MVADKKDPTGWWIWEPFLEKKSAAASSVRPEKNLILFYRLWCFLMIHLHAAKALTDSCRYRVFFVADNCTLVESDLPLDCDVDSWQILYRLPSFSSEHTSSSGRQILRITPNNVRLGFRCAILIERFLNKIKLETATCKLEHCGETSSLPVMLSSYPVQIKLIYNFPSTNLYVFLAFYSLSQIISIQ